MQVAFRRNELRIKNVVIGRIDRRKRRERKCKTNTSDIVIYLSAGFGLSCEPEIDFYMQQNEVLTTFIVGVGWLLEIKGGTPKDYRKIIKTKKKLQIIYYSVNFNVGSESVLVVVM